MSVIISRPFFLFLLLKVKEKGKEKRKRKEISQFFFSRISLSFVNKFDHPLVSLEGHNQVVIFIKQACPLEIERESNRRKLESFRAIKSDLIFNKFPLHLALRRRGGGGPVGCSPYVATTIRKGVEVGNSGRRKKGRKARRKGNLLGNYKVTSSGDAHSCEYSNAITSMIA